MSSVSKPGLVSFTNSFQIRSDEVRPYANTSKAQAVAASVLSHAASVAPGNPSNASSSTKVTPKKIKATVQPCASYEHGDLTELLEAHEKRAPRSQTPSFKVPVSKKKGEVNPSIDSEFKKFAKSARKDSRFKEFKQMDPATRFRPKIGKPYDLSPPMEGTSSQEASSLGSSQLQGISFQEEIHKKEIEVIQEPKQSQLRRSDAIVHQLWLAQQAKKTS
jgi:hypothetical protein